MWSRCSVILIVVSWLFSAVVGQVVHEFGSPNEHDLGRFGFSVDMGLFAEGSEMSTVIIGAGNEISGMENERTGRAYVFDGTSGILYYSFISPDGESGGRFGASVSLAGDIDNDGWRDIAVGAPEESPGKSPYGAGRVHVFSGRTGLLVYSLISPNEQFMGFFGSSVSDIGDIDGDGYADILVGAPYEDLKPAFSSAGIVYAISGQTGFMLRSYVSPNTETGSLFGSSLDKTGDIDEDGYDDIIIGAYGENIDTGPAFSDAGRAYVMSAESGEVVRTFVSPNPEARGQFGFAVSTAGDVDGDEYDDVVIGAPRESISSGDYEDGRAYLFSGATGSLLHALEPPDGEVGGLFGYAVSAAGDVDGDGCGDVIIGVPLGNPASEPSHAGVAHVFSGQTGDLLYSCSSLVLEDGGHFSHSVCGGFDVNQDAFPDVICGAPDETSDSGTERAGHVYLLDGHILGSQPGDVHTGLNLTFVGPSPNPVKYVTEMKLVAPNVGRLNAVLKLFDLRGRQIGPSISASINPGEHTTIRWTLETDRIPAGPYWWRMEAGEQVLVRPMVVLR